jgi:hypothetical protein
VAADAHSSTLACANHVVGWQAQIQSQIQGLTGGALQAVELSLGHSGRVHNSEMAACEEAFAGGASVAAVVHSPADLAAIHLAAVRPQPKAAAGNRPAAA